VFEWNARNLRGGSQARMRSTTAQQKKCKICREQHDVCCRWGEVEFRSTRNFKLIQNGRRQIILETCARETNNYYLLIQMHWYYTTCLVY
jgi:hypothetical protein